MTSCILTVSGHKKTPHYGGVMGGIVLINTCMSFDLFSYCVCEPVG